MNHTTNMDIRLLPGLEGARQARGTAVVIDAFRACVSVCAILAGGARLWPVDDFETARQRRAEDPDVLLAGERGGRRPDDFDLGNSPSALERTDLRGRGVVLATSAGTRGLVAARHADRVVAGAFVNAGAVVDFLVRHAPEHVTLVCLGHRGEIESAEDRACGEYLRARLRGEAVDFAAVAEAVRATPDARKFLDPAKPWFPAEDLDFCLTLDRYAFVPRLVTDAEGRPELILDEPGVG